MGREPSRTTRIRRSLGNGGRRRGTCPVCRRADLALRVSDGKVMPHGKSAASPLGCPGGGDAPYRERKAPAPGSLPVAELRPQVAHDQAPLPELGIDVLVERRDPPPVRLRTRAELSPGDGAA